jgi:hypothetical protein
MYQPRGSKAGANPTIVSYNAVNTYNATSSLVRFEVKKYFTSIFEKTLYPTTMLALYVHSCKFESSRIGSWIQKPPLPP